jgi:hypothetical protein
MPQDDRLNDKQEDLACAIDQGDKHNDGGEIAEATAPGRPGSIPSTGNARWQPIADSLGYAPGKSASNLDALRAVRDEPADNPAQMNEGRSKIPQLNHYDRVIIEWCCGRDSMLGKSSKRSGGCKVVRLTIDDDLRASEGLQKAIQVLQNCPRGRTLLWSSMPCAGGSPWRTLNVAVGEGLEKIGRLRDFRLLWSNFELMARAVMDVGRKVVIEWPERCKYWTDISVMRFVKQRSFVDSIFHGCACGLVAKHNMPIGQPMKKPWRSSSNDPIRLSFLNRKCQGGRDRAECRGRDCKASGDYTPAVIDAIHSDFLRSCGPSDEKLVGECNDGTLQAVEMGLPGVESLDDFCGGTASLSTSTDNLICVSERSRITLGHSRSTHTPLSDIATTTHCTTAGIANHAPSPSMSCGYVSDLRSGNIANNAGVRTSFPFSGDIGYDGDHAGVSDDLSCVGGVSVIDEAQFLEEIYERVDDHVPGRSPRGSDYLKCREGYSYYYHRFTSRALDGGTTSNLGAHDDVEDDINCLSANDDDPPDNLGAHHDVVTNIDCLTQRSGAVRRDYVEILHVLPNLQHDIACACVAISHRPIEGPCDGAELNSGQERLLIAAAMPPKEPQGVEHGGTPHQGWEKGNLSLTAQPIAVSKIGSASSAKVGPIAVGSFFNASKTNTAIPGHTGPPIESIKVGPPRDIVLGDAAMCNAEFPLPSAAKPNDRKWGDVAVTRRPVTTGPTDDLFAREPQPSTMSSSTSSAGRDDISVCGIGTEDQIVKVERVDARSCLVTNQGRQQRKLSDAQLLLLPMGESLMITDEDQIEKVERELITQLAAMGTFSLTTIGSTSVAPGQLESISSTVDAMDVERKDGEFLWIDRSRTITSSSAGFSTPSAGSTVDSTVCFSLSSSGNTMDVDQHGDAVDQRVSDFTLLDAPGTRESTSRAVEASSTVNMLDDEGLGLSVPEIEINGEQIAAARQAIEKSKTQVEFVDDAEIKLRRF